MLYFLFLLSFSHKLHCTVNQNITRNFNVISVNLLLLLLGNLPFIKNDFKILFLFSCNDMVIFL